jgi:hypothetical protein
MSKTFDIVEGASPLFVEVELSTGELVRIFPPESTFCSEHLHVTIERRVGSKHASREEHQIYIRDLIITILENSARDSEGAKH